MVIRAVVGWCNGCDGGGDDYGYNYDNCGGVDNDDDDDDDDSSYISSNLCTQSFDCGQQSRCKYLFDRAFQMSQHNSRTGQTVTTQDNPKRRKKQNLNLFSLLAISIAWRKTFNKRNKQTSRDCRTMCHLQRLAHIAGYSCYLQRTHGHHHASYTHKRRLRKPATATHHNTDITTGQLHNNFNHFAIQACAPCSRKIQWQKSRKL